MSTAEKLLTYLFFVPSVIILHGLFGGLFVYVAWSQVYHLINGLRPLTYGESVWLCVLVRSLMPNVATLK